MFISLNSNDYSILKATILLLNESEDLDRALDIIIKDEFGERIHFDKYEFFILKKSVWKVVQNATLDINQKKYIMKKLEKLRFILFCEFHFKSK